MARDCRDAPARAAMKRAKAFNVGLPRRFRPPRHNRVTERSLCWRLAGQVCGRLPAIPKCRRLEQETRRRALKLCAQLSRFVRAQRRIHARESVIAERQPHHNAAKIRASAGANVNRGPLDRRAASPPLGA